MSFINRATVLLMCLASACCFSVTPSVPKISSPTSLSLRSSPVASGASLLRSAGRKCTSLSMVTPEQEAAFRAAEEAEIIRKRKEEEELERRYIQQSSGMNFRQNSQDGLLFAMGGLIIVLPVVFVGIAIATGYIPLDYIR